MSNYIIDGSSDPISPVGAKLIAFDAAGNPGWLPASGQASALHIGVPGSLGFGVGVCPADVLPTGFTPLPGYADPASPNHGNYQFSDGSVMVWVPKFYYRINNAANPTYARFTPNDIHVVGAETFASRAAAEIGGYALHRAFIDGGAEQPGFMVDKYLCSKNALGTGWVGSSIRNGLPISADPAHNPVADLTASGAVNQLKAFVDAAKARDGANGVANATSRFFCCSRFIISALALLSIAHGQACNSPSTAAWFEATATTNFPKGCNDNALKDTNDTQVKYQSDGYSNCGKTGSGSPFAKTTHNGQECGVADLNGLMWEANIGFTCIATTKSITAATKANPCALTVPSHGLTTGQVIQATSVGGMVELNDKLFTVTVVDANTITLDGVNSTAYTTYTSGGSIAYGAFYAAKEATRMRDFTSGATLATDHWGATGVAAMMESLAFPLLAAAGGTAMGMKYGNGANQVLSGAASGLGHALTGLFAPKDTGGMSSGGTNLFGTDQIYQYIRNELCALSGGYWNNSSNAGVCALNLSYGRTNASSGFGFRCACYPG